MNRLSLFCAARRAALLAALVLLAGCTAPFSATVTTFQQWPADTAGQTWRVATPDADQNALEYAAYADLLRAAMASSGLIEAAVGQPARFTVGLRYRVESARITRREPIDPFFHGGWGRPWGWAWGGYYTPAWGVVPQDVWRNILTLSIRDAMNGNTEVYRANAISINVETHPIAQAMPQLMRAVFEGFPGNNGQVRTVRYRQP